VPDLRVGTAFSYDEIPPDATSTVLGRDLSIRELLGTAQVQYRYGPFDLIGEFAWIEHDVRSTGMVFHHNAGYLQVAVHVDQLTPYARMDYRTMERMDPFYLGLGRDRDIVRPVVGVRYDPIDTMAAKLEVGFSREGADGTGSFADRDVLSLAFQVSWVL